MPYAIPSLFLALFGILTRRTVGVGFLVSYRIVSLDLSTLNMVSNFIVVTIGIETLLVGFPASCHITFPSFSCLFCVLSQRRDERRRFSSVIPCGFPGLMLPKMESWVGVATFGVGLLASCIVVSLDHESWVGFATTGVVMLGVGFPASYLVATSGQVCLKWNLESASRGQVSI
jgi:hypothetical protein